MRPLSAPGEDPVDGKRAARAEVRRRRRDRASWAPDDPRRAAEGAAVADALLAGAESAGITVGPTTTVASYLALPSEPETGALHEELTRRGAQIIVPVLLPDKDLTWVALADGAIGGRGETPATHLGVDGIAQAGLIVVPALAVDREGYRLGQGGGSYDRALPRRKADAVIVAVVDGDGLWDRVPHAGHDARVDAVIAAGRPWTPLPIVEFVCENRSATP